MFYQLCERDQLYKLSVFIFFPREIVLSQCPIYLYMGRVTRLAKQRIAAAAAGLDLLCNHSPPLLLLLLLLTPKMTNVSWQSDPFSSLSSASWPRLIQKAGAAPTVSLDGGAKVKVERRRQRFSSGGILHRVFKCSIGAFSLPPAPKLSTGNQGVICLCAEAVEQREREHFSVICVFVHFFWEIVFVHFLALYLSICCRTSPRNCLALS